LVFFKLTLVELFRVRQKGKDAVEIREFSPAFRAMTFRIGLNDFSPALRAYQFDQHLFQLAF
jgi:hypothetical protein